MVKLLALIIGFTTCILFQNCSQAFAPLNSHESASSLAISSDITAGQVLTSGATQLSLTNGDLILTAGGKTMWRTNVACADCKATVDADGRLTLGSWSSNSQSHPGARLKLYDFPPYLALIAPDNTIAWAPPTNLVFFAGSDPYANYSGKPTEQDFDQLFTNDQAWPHGLEHVQVVKFYAQFLDQAPDEKLQMVFSFLKAHHMALAVELGLNKVGASGCGNGVEGYVTDGVPARIARRILKLGGDLRYISLDESFGANRNGSGCALQPDAAARLVIAKFKVMQTIFPEVLLGDTENLPTGNDDGWFHDYTLWAQTFANESPSPLQYFHWDVDWANPNWNYSVPRAKLTFSQLKIPFGIIENENAGVTTDKQSWTYSAIDNLRKYREFGYTDTDQVVFQTWSGFSTQATPETDTNAQTYLIPYFYTNTHPLYRFANGGKHSYAKTYSAQNFERVSARFYTRLQSGMKPLYECTGGAEWFLSGDANCESGAGSYTSQGVMGYLWPSPGAGLLPVYRMYNAQTKDRLFTTDLNEAAGYTNEGILGYSLAP